MYSLHRCWSVAWLGFVLSQATTHTRASAFDQHPLTTASQRKTHQSPFTEEFSHFVRQALQEWHVPGLAISIVDGNATHAEGFGFATLPDVLATPETLWYVGSTSKAHTTATLASLIDSGNFSEFERGWKTTISSIIRDDFVVQDQWAASHLTLEDAATHRTGFTRHDQSVVWTPESPRSVVKHTVRNLRNLPMHLEPRTEFHYCNLFYTVLTHVAETVTGKWLGDLARDLIWTPLGMNSTYFQLEDAVAGPEHLSQGYIWDEEEQKLKPLPFVASPVINGAGAVISNVLDYAKWMRCLLDQAPPFTQRVHEELRKPRMISSFDTVASDITTYSLSWFRATIYGKSVTWHSGSTMSHGALVYWFPDEQYGITIFSNSVTPLRNVLMYRLIEERFDVPQSQRIDVAKSMKEAQRREKQKAANATHMLYPNIPSEPLPPSLKLEDHAGVYENVGYGIVRFSVGTHPARPNKETLVADRLDHAWNETIRLEHVSGDHWVWFSYIFQGPTESISYSKAEFRIGSDGKIATLELDLYDYQEDVTEGLIVYHKKD